MYNTLIKISEELKQDYIVKACIKGMEKVHDVAYDLKWAGKYAQARELISNTKESLMYDYPIYKQYVTCCLLLKQWDYGNFNTEFNRECSNFIKRYYSK